MSQATSHSYIYRENSSFLNPHNHPIWRRTCDYAPSELPSLSSRDAITTLSPRKKEAELEAGKQRIADELRAALSKFSHTHEPQQTAAEALAEDVASAEALFQIQDLAAAVLQTPGST